MNLKRLRKEKIKNMKQLAKDIDYATPQKTLATTYEPSPIDDYRDPDCMYRRACAMPSCIGCRRLK